MSSLRDVPLGGGLRRLLRRQNVLPPFLRPPVAETPVAPPLSTDRTSTAAISPSVGLHWRGKFRTLQGGFCQQGARVDNILDVAVEGHLGDACRPDRPARGGLTLGPAVALSVPAASWRDRRSEGSYSGFGWGGLSCF